MNVDIYQSLLEQYEEEDRVERKLVNSCAGYQAEVVHILYNGNDCVGYYGRAIAIVEISGHKLTIKATLFERRNGKMILLLPSYTKDGKRTQTVEMDGDLEFFLTRESIKQYEEMKKGSKG